MSLDSTMYPTIVRFRCEECDELLRGFADHDARCPDCDTMQTAPSEDAA